jgi:hypothetical protein
VEGIQLSAAESSIYRLAPKQPKEYGFLMMPKTNRMPMRGTPKQHFGAVESCIDYHSYVYTIDPDLKQERYQATRLQLMKLGSVNEERMGVIYVRGPWGFYVIPQYGYPTLRVSFFHDTPTKEIDDILSLISAAFEAPEAIVNQGDLDE